MHTAICFCRPEETAEERDALKMGSLNSAELGVTLKATDCRLQAGVVRNPKAVQYSGLRKSQTSRHFWLKLNMASSGIKLMSQSFNSVLFLFLLF